MPPSKTIAVAMSGGVDSSTVAAMLRAEGHRVIGLTMQLWNQRRLAGHTGMPETVQGRCCSLDDVYDARRVAETLGIPYYVVNHEDRFERELTSSTTGFVEHDEGSARVNDGQGYQLGFQSGPRGLPTWGRDILLVPSDEGVTEGVVLQLRQTKAGSFTKQRWVELLQRHYGGDWSRFTADFLPPAGVQSWPALLAATERTRMKPGGAGIRAAAIGGHHLLRERQHLGIGFGH